MKKITVFLLTSLYTSICMVQAQLTNECNSTITGGSVHLDSALNLTNLITIQQFILKQGKTQTYCNMYNDNPFYQVENYSFYLNPDSGQRNINCDPTKSGFRTLVIRNMGWGQDQYRYIEFKGETDGDIIVSWRKSDLNIKQIRERTEQALKTIIEEVTRIEKNRTLGGVK